MATITGATIDQAPASLKLSPDKYTTLNDLVKTTKDFVLPDLVQSYGDQGITGFLNLVGAVKGAGTNDQIDWWEAGRRHRTISVTQTSSKSGDQTTITFAADTTNGVPLLFSVTSTVREQISPRTSKTLMSLSAPTHS